MIKITVTENDIDMECGLIAVYNFNDYCFAALIPLDDNGEPADADVLLYECEVGEDGELSLYDIEYEDEYDDALNGFNIVIRKLSRNA